MKHLILSDLNIQHLLAALSHVTVSHHDEYPWANRLYCKIKAAASQGAFLFDLPECQPEEGQDNAGHHTDD